jgi:hypothetical protein
LRGEKRRFMSSQSHTQGIPGLRQKRKYYMPFVTQAPITAKPSEKRVLTVNKGAMSGALRGMATEKTMPEMEDKMDLGGRIIIVFIITVISVYLLNLEAPVHDFICSVITVPDPGHVRNSAIYHLGKICIFLIALVGIVKLLRNN